MLSQDNFIPNHHSSMEALAPPPIFNHPPQLSLGEYYTTVPTLINEALLLQEHSAARSVLQAFCHGNVDGQSMLAATLVPTADQGPRTPPPTPTPLPCSCYGRLCLITKYHVKDSYAQVDIVWGGYNSRTDQNYFKINYI